MRKGSKHLHRPVYSLQNDFYRVVLSRVERPSQQAELLG